MHAYTEKTDSKDGIVFQSKLAAVSDLEPEKDGRRDMRVVNWS